MNICDYLYVLDFGKLIFEGTPDQVRTSSVVRAAYLGEAEGAPILRPDDTETGLQSEAIS
jgi:hypothetical protein